MSTLLVQSTPTLTIRFTGKRTTRRNAARSKVSFGTMVNQLKAFLIWGVAPEVMRFPWLKEVMR